VSCIGKVEPPIHISAISNFVVCRDLAARNVLLDVNLQPKVSDFGRSLLLQEEQDLAIDTQLDDAPVRWMAPETIHSCSYSRKSDVW
jgi:ephrin-A